MPHFRFWRNLLLIAAAHAGLVVGLVRLSHAPPTALAQNVMWLDGSDIAAPAQNSTNTSQQMRAEDQQPPETTPEPDEDEPVLTAAKSDIQLPALTPTPTATPTPAPTATPRPKSTASPTPSSKPKSKPTPKAKASPKSTPKKIVFAKASPTPTPRSVQEATDKVPPKNIDVSLDAKPTDGNTGDVKPSVGNNPAANAGAGGTAAGGGGRNTSVNASFGKMLHDRLYGEWSQPTGLPAGIKLIARVKIRIERDGRVSDFKIVRSSGNVVVDESIESMSKRVTHVDPLPKELGGNKPYEIAINFELNSDE